MRIEKVRIENYRCLHSLEMKLDELTVLIGANSMGKSSVLKALGWFFEGGELEPEDVCGQTPGARVLVAVTFGDLTQADHDALGKFATGETAIFWRTWSSEDGVKLTGRDRKSVV